jgi:peroxiredoxin (alkyl hydroperoxide reductase subunit C)
MENQEKPATLPRIGEPHPRSKRSPPREKSSFPNNTQEAGSYFSATRRAFTPVCTSEFMTFCKTRREFNKLNCKLVGLSVDGLYSHIAWLRTIKEKIEYKGMKGMEVKFPLIEDITMEVATLRRIQPVKAGTKACAPYLS